MFAQHTKLHIHRKHSGHVGFGLSNSGSLTDGGGHGGHILVD